MKIAVTSKGTDLDSEVDSMFGKPSYTLIVDTFSLGVDVLDHSPDQNEAVKTKTQSAELISDKGISVLLTGSCKPDSLKPLNDAGVKVAKDINGTVREAVTSFVEGKVSFIDTV